MFESILKGSKKKKDPEKGKGDTAPEGALSGESGEPAERVDSFAQRVGRKINAVLDFFEQPIPPAADAAATSEERSRWGKLTNRAGQLGMSALARVRRVISREPAQLEEPQPWRVGAYRDGSPIEGRDASGSGEYLYVPELVPSFEDEAAGPPTPPGEKAFGEAFFAEGSAPPRGDEDDEEPTIATELSSDIRLKEETYSRELIQNTRLRYLKSKLEILKKAEDGPTGVSGFAERELGRLDILTHEGEAKIQDDIYSSSLIRDVFSSESDLNGEGVKKSFIKTLAEEYGIPEDVVIDVLNQQKAALELQARQAAVDKHALLKGFGKGTGYIGLSLGLGMTGVGAGAGIALVFGLRTWDTFRLDKKTKAAIAKKKGELQQALQNNDSNESKWMIQNLTAALAQAKMNNIHDRIESYSRQASFNYENANVTEEMITYQFLMQYAPDLIETCNDDFLKNDQLSQETTKKIIAALEKAGVYTEYKAVMAFHAIDQSNYKLRQKAEAKSLRSQNLASKLLEGLNKLVNPKDLPDQLTVVGVFTAAGVLARAVPGVSRVLGAIAGWKLGGIAAEYGAKRFLKRLSPSQVVNNLNRKSIGYAEMDDAQSYLNDPEFRSNHPANYAAIREAYDVYLSEMILNAQDAAAVVAQNNKEKWRSRTGLVAEKGFKYVVKAGGAFAGSFIPDVLNGILGGQSSGQDWSTIKEQLVGKEALVRSGSWLDEATHFHGGHGAGHEPDAVAARPSRSAAPSYQRTESVLATGPSAASGGTEPATPAPAAEPSARPEAADLRSTPRTSAATPREPGPTPSPTAGHTEATPGVARAYEAHPATAAPAAPAAEPAPAATSAEPAATAPAEPAIPEPKIGWEKVTVHKGEGFWHALERQLSDQDTAKKFGWDGKANLDSWMNHKITEILNKTTMTVDGKEVHVIDPKTGQQLWVMEPNKYAIVLNGTADNPSIEISDAQTHAPLNQDALNRALQQVAGQVHRAAETVQPSAAAHVEIPTRLDPSHLYHRGMTEDAYREAYVKRYLGPVLGEGAGMEGDTLNSASMAFALEHVSPADLRTIEQGIHWRYEQIQELIHEQQAAAADTGSGTSEALDTTILPGFDTSTGGESGGGAASEGDMVISGAIPLSAAEPISRIGNAVIVENINLQKPPSDILTDLHDSINRNGAVTEFGLRFAHQGSEIVVSPLSDPTNTVPLTPELLAELNKKLPNSNSAFRISRTDFADLVAKATPESSAPDQLAA